MSLLSPFAREEKLTSCAKALYVTAGTEPDADLGPVISKQVCTLINFLTNQYCDSKLK